MTKRRTQYSLGSWLGENAGNLIKTGAGAALTATGVGAPLGAGLIASGASGLAADNLVNDPNAKAAIQTTGNVTGMMAGAGLLGFANGGNLKLAEINNGGTHEQNPMGGVPMGPSASVEQGETKWQDYIFSDRLMTGNRKETFAEASKKIQKKYPRENDTPSQKALEREMTALMAKQEALRTKAGLNETPQMAAYGGRIKYPDGGSLVSDKVLSVDSSGIIPKTIYDVDKLSPKAKAAYLKNPELFSSAVGIGEAPGAPKQESTIDTNREAIMKSLNSAAKTTKTPTSIPEKALKWMDEPGITGWQQARLGNRNVFRTVTIGEDGKPVYGNIEYKMGGRIKAAYGLDLMSEVDLSGVRPQDVSNRFAKNNPNLMEVGSEDFLRQGEIESAAAVAAQNEMNNQARIQAEANIPSDSPYNTTAAYETDDAVADETTKSTTPENNYVTGPGAGAPVGKGASGFDKYDAIAMGAQLLPAMYNIGMGLRKPDTVSLGRVSPRTVDYSASMKATEDAFTQQANTLSEAIRRNATSSGQALSNRVAFANRAALDKSNQLGQISERQSNANQQIRGRADEMNLQIAANEEQINAQNKGIQQTALNLGLAQVGQAAGTLNRDRRLNKVEQESIGMLGDGTSYGMVWNPTTNRYERVFKS